MWCPGQITEKMLKQEISRRAKVNRARELLNSYYDVRLNTRYIAQWMYYMSGLEFRRGNDDEAEWYRWKCDTMCNFEEEYGDDATRLFGQYRRDLMRDVHYPPRS